MGGKRRAKRPTAHRATLERRRSGACSALDHSPVRSCELPCGSSRRRSRCRDSPGQSGGRRAEPCRCPRRVEDQAARGQPARMHVSTSDSGRPQNGPRGIWKAESTRRCVCCGPADETPGPSGRRADSRAAVFARFRRAATNAKMPPAAAHPALVAEGDMRLADRIGVVVIILRFREEEDVFVVGRGPRLRRRTASHWACARCSRPAESSPRRSAQAPLATAPSCCAVVVLVADHQPQRAGRFHHAAAFAEDRPQSLDVFSRRRFAADLLAFAAIVALLPIGRAGDDAIDAARWASFEETASASP